MESVATPPLPVSTFAARKAAANRAANLAALARTQPDLPVPPPDADREWVLGRDGSLTARTALGTGWLSGCSLPLRAATHMLRAMDVTGSVCCFLAPAHAAQLRVALGRLNPSQAIVAMVPDPTHLPDLLAADDFSADLASHRLWFAVGGEGLLPIYDEHPGLPVPSQFLRSTATDPAVADALVPAAQRVIGSISQRVAQRLESLRSRPSPAPDGLTRVAVLAPSHFRLWRPTTHVLLREIDNVIDAVHPTCLDSDDPVHAAPIALAELAAHCDALLTADLGRGGLPGLVADETPWVSWITTRRVPPFRPEAVADQLLLVSPSLVSLARAAGWPVDRLQVAGWPAIVEPAESPRGEPHLLVLCDLPPSRKPPEVEQFSSLGVLWDAIEQELLMNPLSLGDDATRYLRDRGRRCHIEPASLPATRFLESCIQPAFARGIVRLLAAAGLPVRVAGHGWDDPATPPLASAGPVRSFDRFVAVTRAASAIVNVWPDSAEHHPVQSVHRPVLHPQGRTRDGFLADARQVLGGSVPLCPSRGRLMSADVLLRALRP